MKVYGFRIGDCGVEFTMREDREKAMLLFTKGACVKIRSYAGPKYEDTGAMFATYERNSEEVLVNCSICKGTFSGDSCPRREHPDADYNGKISGTTKTDYICDGCFAAREKDAEIAAAQKRLEEARA